MGLASLSDNNLVAGLYSRMRDWCEQLKSLLDEDKGQERVAQDRYGRVVTVIGSEPGGVLEKLASIISFWVGHNDRAQERAPAEKLFNDISIMQRSVVELNEKLGLSDGGSYQEEDISVPTVRSCLYECDRLMTSQAGQLLRTRNHLEDLWIQAQKDHADPEGNLRFTGDMLQTCYARFLATIPPEDDVLESFGKFNEFVTQWLDDKKETISTAGPLDSALASAYQKLRNRCREFLEYSITEIQDKTHVSPEDLQGTSSPVGDAIPKESVREDILSLIETSRQEVKEMTILEGRFPDGRQMLMDDLGLAERAFLQELEDLPSEKVTVQWFQGIENRLLKMRETMYYALRSPDRKAPFYSARVGLRNHHTDCEPNTHTQIYSHLSCYDYFLYRVLPVTPLPEGELPELDLSPLDPLNAQIQELQVQVDSIEDQLANDPICLVKPGSPQEMGEEIQGNREKLEKDKRELSSQQYLRRQERDDLERKLRGEWKVLESDREIQVSQHRECLGRQRQQRFWVSKFQELRDSAYKGTNTLHQPDEGNSHCADGFPDDPGGLIPPGYTVHGVVLIPDRPETLDELQTRQVGVFVCGDHGHWACLLANGQGGLDRVNDAWVTHNYFQNMEAMLDYYLHKVQFKDQLVTAIFP